MNELIMVAGMAIVTFLIRYPTMVLVGKIPLPDRVSVGVIIGRVGDLIVGDMFGESVGAQQHDVVPLMIAHRDDRLGLVATDRAGEDVLERRSLRG